MAEACIYWSVPGGLLNDLRSWTALPRQAREHGVDPPPSRSIRLRASERPLIFVEVALMDRIADAVPPLLNAQSTSKDPSRANTAVFYSISNCHPGLRGVALGNFLIKKVVDVLSQELPRLKVFCTLSPIPGFMAWLGPILNRPDDQGNGSLAHALKVVARELVSTLRVRPAMQRAPRKLLHR